MESVSLSVGRGHFNSKLQLIVSTDQHSLFVKGLSHQCAHFKGKNVWLWGVKVYIHWCIVHVSVIVEGWSILLHSRIMSRWYFGRKRSDFLAASGGFSLFVWPLAVNRQVPLTVSSKWVWKFRRTHFQTEKEAPVPLILLQTLSFPSLSVYIPGVMQLQTFTLDLNRRFFTSHCFAYSKSASVCLFGILLLTCIYIHGSAAHHFMI